jgi:dephospho-CoA kinase
MSRWVLGVTGGIGAGKTAITNQLQDWGIDIVDADLIARDVVAQGTPGLAAISQRFGDSILLTDGTLNRAKLREIIFSEPEQKTWLNNLLHPLIRESILSALQQSQTPYVVLSAPLLFENGLQRYCNRTLLVDVPVDIQLARTSKRDNVDVSQVKAIINAQLSRQEKCALADDLLDNTGTLEQTLVNLHTLHVNYLQQAAK